MQRMGVVLVGPSGCGKSTVLTLLRLALSKIGHPVRYHVFNPKSMLRVQLLGRIDPDTREWTDGVLTHSARLVVKEDPGRFRPLLICNLSFIGHKQIAPRFFHTKTISCSLITICCPTKLAVKTKNSSFCMVGRMFTYSVYMMHKK